MPTTARMRDVCLQKRQWLLGLALLASLAMACSTTSAAEDSAAKRPITVRDTIEMTEFADRWYFLGGAPEYPVAIFSPDRKRFLIRLKQGSVERNMVEYRLLLYDSDQVLASPQGEVLMRMSSSSNREAIQQVRWLDNHTVTFLGENPGKLPAVYEINVDSKQLTRLTNHSTAVVSYDISRDRKQLIFEAAPRKKRIYETEEALRDGVVITSQTVNELLDDGGERDDPIIDRELFVQGPNKEEKRVPSFAFLTEYLPLSLSPDGRFAVLPVYVSTIPDAWANYEDEVLRPYIVQKRKPGTMSNVVQYMLVDVAQATMRPLLDAPVRWSDEAIAWPSAGDSVIVTGAFLPFGAEETEDGARKHGFAVEVEIPTSKIHKITGDRVSISHWNAQKQEITLALKHAVDGPTTKTYAKRNGRWIEIPVSAKESDDSIEISLEEDKNAPPRIFAKDRISGNQSLLLDLNPQLGEFAIGTVETIRWKATDGREVEGGLYFPPSFERGKRYPLVIQTHGYDPQRFCLNGPWNSAFAAQPLAAQGIMVLQVGDSVVEGEDRKYTNTPAEGPRRMAAFEGAVDELDRRGLIDRDRVGLIGFSRTAFHVAFALTHSHYKFRAAVLADGFDGGYMGHLLWRLPDGEGVNGGQPVGPSLTSWFEKSPAFQIDKVSTPVRLEYYGPLHFLAGWEWFSLSSILNKPVHFVWLPRGTHLLVKPCERMASQQGTVDWFEHWLLNTGQDRDDH
jgi:dipeptidyl aminopeptidase/acylaminoacyl peptidase